jgi:hypothetical protein
MKRILTLITVAVISLAASGTSLAQDNPFVGTWKLNLANSKYSGEQPPKSQTRTVVAQGDGLKVTYEGIAADGSPISYSYTTNLDGKDVAYSGRHPFGSDTVAIKRTDANTIAVISKKAGKTVYTAAAVVSNDGKVLTITLKGVNGEGQPISVTTVWDKQPNVIVDPPRWKRPNTP